MRAKKFLFILCLVMAPSLHEASAQTAETPSAPSAATSATVVPMLVRYDGVAVRGNGSPASGAGITFLIYKDEKGGDPLWIETQSVNTDALGKYEVYLGSTYSAGLPPGLFGTGEARWLEVQIAGETPAPRTLLTSVPYALKAADAATLGGLPASAFARAAAAGIAAVTPDGITSDTASTVTTTGGTSFYLPKFNAASTVIDSEIYDTGTSVGIGDIPNPSARLDVNGGMIMRGNMTVSRTGNATSSKAFPSYGFDFFSNVYNSSTKATDNPYFQLQSEPTGNNTSSPSATFNLFFSNNGSTPADTGFYINPNGTVHFATGQTFPGAAELNVADTYSASAPQTFDAAITASGGINMPLGVGTSTPGYDLEVYDAGATVAGMAMVSGGSDAAISLNNAGSGGHEYWLDSGSGSAGIGAGNLGIYDRTYGSTRMVVNPHGLVGIGTTNPLNQLEVDSVPSYFADAISASGTYYGPSFNGGSTGSGTIGVIGTGGNTDRSTGSVAGDGGAFTGGNADTTADAGYGLDVYGGYGYASGEYQPAARFQDDILVNGNTISSVVTSKIDHPSDPANKYFNHASIQSSELMNLYTGNVTTDGSGGATVKLPDWFEAENADFRYQLTVIGRQAQAWIAEEVGSRQFKIGTSAANVKVSWQITAVRQDAYAKAHPLVVEEAKPAREVGFYKHPELYGQPANKQTEWGRNPRMMKRMEAQRAATNARKPQAAPMSAVHVPTVQSSLIEPAGK